ncbi:hypothetical protein B7R22_13110 [Subtercola boreus]|uniref:histidine kinase n=1 Tax=Subtercola boreus TaxID=120213 RepID=A0A3E0VV79_9MICO|nr:histidine kinase [Subtercola boreus]RFA13590.1 hypothetical protein B7R22_13110 [Subtercola boreus]
MAVRTVSSGTWERPRPSAQALRRDVLVAGLLVLATAASAFIYSSIVPSPPAAWWVTVPWAIVIAGSLAARRRFPAVVAVVVSGAFLAGQLMVVPEVLFSNICLYLAIYSLGAWGANRRVATIVRVVIIVGMFLWLFSFLLLNTSTPSYIDQVGGHGMLDPFVAFAAFQVMQNLLYFAAAYYFGNGAWSSALARHQLETRTRELQAEREISQAQALVLERVRIARELHDVVAHHVSVMGVQAGAARRVLATVRGDGSADPAQLAKAVAAVAVIEQNARQAVDDLHHLLGALRQPGTGETSAADDASTHGVEQLPALIDSSRRAGLAVDFSVVGTPRPVSPATGLNVYRIAQEALTNCRKHAGSAVRVDARLRYLDDAIEIEVGDDGHGSVRPAASIGAEPRGLGLVGMRERVDAAGGILETGPKARGGYVVRARLPLAPAEVPA